jgi:hypothetical protein
MRFLKSAPSLLIAIALTGSAGAATVIATLVQYATPAGNEFAPSAVAGGLIAGMLGSGTSLADLEAGEAIPGSVFLNPTQSSPTAADARANQQFFQFTLSSTSSSTSFQPENLTFSVGKGGDTLRGWAVYTSLDGFTLPVASSDIAAVNPNLETAAVPLTGFALDDEPVTFRIYAYSPAAGQGLFFENISVAGLVSVPETSAFALAAVFGVLAIVRRQRFTDFIR